MSGLGFTISKIDGKMEVGKCGIRNAECGMSKDFGFDGVTMSV
jgi:hypothetical protein